MLVGGALVHRQRGNLQENSEARPCGVQAWIHDYYWCVFAEKPRAERKPPFLPGEKKLRTAGQVLTIACALY